MSQSLLAVLAETNSHRNGQLSMSSINRVRARIEVTSARRFTAQDRERVHSGVECALRSCKNAWDASVQFDKYLKRTGGRSRLPILVTFIDSQVSATETSELYSMQFSP